MVKIGEILQIINHIKFIGNPEEDISQPIPLNVNNIQPTAIMWVNDNNVHLIEKITCGTIICSEKNIYFNKGCNYIISSNPRFSFQQIMEAFFNPKVTPSISSRAFIDSTVVMGKDNFIGHNVVIEENCILGNNVVIDHNTIIKTKTIIGNHVKIGSNCTIGGIGFGYEKNMNGEYVLMPHLGNVVLLDYVEIGNNSCVDRAVMGSTILSGNVKVDNLVHIAHGVSIGKNSLIIANAMIGGSTQIGENVWVAPSASILNKKKVESGSFIGMGAVVIADVGSNEIIIGNPGKVLVKKNPN